MTVLASAATEEHPMPTTPIAAASVVTSLTNSFAAAKQHETPYRHWFIENCLSPEAAKLVDKLPFPAPELGGISGKREVHNATRKYFDAENRGKYPVVAAVTDALQDPRVIKATEAKFGCKLAGSYLRVEFAQDIDGFWLEPHTDLGVKLFTFLLYLSDEPGHAALGTDIYDANKKHVATSPFVPNGAMIFVPSNNTYHGFEARHIPGVRKSVIINYVTNDWKAREQLAFPHTPIPA
jgi:hypothetical protein